MTLKAKIVYEMHKSFKLIFNKLNIQIETLCLFDFAGYNFLGLWYSVGRRGEGEGYSFVTLGLGWNMCLQRGWSPLFSLWVLMESTRNVIDTALKPTLLGKPGSN